MPEIVKPSYNVMEVIRDGPRIIVLNNGAIAFNIPWRAAQQLIQALRFYVAEAEEEEKAAQIVSDQAILNRAGVPIALSRRADIQQEAARQSGGIPSGAKLGIPKVVKHEPTN